MESRTIVPVSPAKCLIKYLVVIVLACLPLIIFFLLTYFSSEAPQVDMTQQEYQQLKVRSMRLGVVLSVAFLAVGWFACVIQDICVNLPRHRMYLKMKRATGIP